MFGARLRLLREERKMSQLELSKSLGIGNVTLSQYENGARKPDNDTLVKISNYFDVSTDYLLGQTEWKNPPSLTKKDERDYSARTGTNGCRSGQRERWAIFLRRQHGTVRI